MFGGCIQGCLIVMALLKCTVITPAGTQKAANSLDSAPRHTEIREGGTREASPVFSDQVPAETFPSTVFN